MKESGDQIKHLKTNHAPIIAVVYLMYLFLLQFLVNDIWIGWENANIPVGLLGSWIWAFMKIAYWCLPVLAYLFFFRKEDVPQYKQMYSLSIKKPLILLLIPCWAFLILVQNGFKVPALSYDYVVNGIIATPLIEEFVFRGFILRELSRRLTSGNAIIVQGTFFSLNHLPWLYALGLFRTPTTLFSRLLFLALFGMVSGYLVKNTKSILPSVLFHAVNNILY